MPGEGEEPVWRAANIDRTKGINGTFKIAKHGKAPDMLEMGMAWAPADWPQFLSRTDERRLRAELRRIDAASAA